ncbi:MAG: hypothetical protein JWP09_614 [Candidatus Taylorbacteria bacterium]|nr:hypothetical protein [Candidatus Taylorbacteria bacterium]
MITFSKIWENLFESRLESVFSTFSGHKIQKTSEKFLKSFVFCARGGTRTRTVLRPGDFKSPMATITSPGQFYIYDRESIPKKRCFLLRCRPGSNRRITVLQTAALTTSPLHQYFRTGDSLHFFETFYQL